MANRRQATVPPVFGSGRRENHDASSFYDRFQPPVISSDETVTKVGDLGDGCFVGDSRSMHQLPDSSVALVVTSPPYFVGKEYELAVAGKGSAGIPVSYMDYLQMLHEVFAECVRVLEPGGRIAVNVANLGRRPYRSLSADVIKILQDELGLLMRGEVIWQKAEGATGSVAWGSFRSASNPVLRDVTERIVVASKGRFDRARRPSRREGEGLPHKNTVTSDEFMEATLDLWRIDSEHARRVGHPAPFPVELPRRLIDLYTFRDDVVLDPFLGSGSTLVAALHAGRRGVGYDVNPEYVALATRRLEAERERRTERTMAWRRRDLSGTDNSQGGLFREEEDNHQVSDWNVGSGKKASDVSLEALVAAGFEVVKAPAIRRDLGIRFPFTVTDQANGALWYVDVAGAFTTARPGMRRTEVIWRTVGKAHVLASGHNGSDPSKRPRLLVLTPRLPRPNSDGDRALRTIGGSGLFDAFELFQGADMKRLAHYANQTVDRPLDGFWTADEIESRFP